MADKPQEQVSQPGPQLLAIPVDTVVKDDDLRKLLNSGWAPLGVFVISEGAAIATPGNPNAGLGQRCNVFARREPSMPLGAVLAMLGDIMARRITAADAAKRLRPGNG